MKYKKNGGFRDRNQERGRETKMMKQGNEEKRGGGELADNTQSSNL